MRNPLAYLAVLFFCIAASFSSALAATYIVTTTEVDGTGSLADAIRLANANPGPDLITFNIATGAQTIYLFTPVYITDAVIIDATTQPGFLGSPIIEITRFANFFPQYGLEVTSGGSGTTLRGMVFNGFYGAGIHLSGGGGNVIEGNFLGTDLSGTIARGGQSGLRVDGSHNNIIGGSTPSKRNLISGNSDAGIYFYNANQNVVIGNYLGTDKSGMSRLGNNTGVTIGPGNYNQIGGVLPEERNILSGNAADGVFLAGGTGNHIINNYIGLNAAGTGTVRNQSTGVYFSGVTNCIVGGTTAAERNIISGNVNGAAFLGSQTTGNQLIGNFIGTDPTGTYAIPNTSDAVRCTNTNGNIIGKAGAGNVISGNGGRGIYMYGENNTSSGFSSIQGNMIGTAGDGVSPLGNGSDGIYLTNLSKNVFVGGNNPSEGNQIAYNPGYGIRLDSFGNEIHGVLIRSNSFWNNGRLGISYTINGTPAMNTICNTQTNGPNFRQNYPVINSAKRIGSSVQITGTLDSAPSGTYTIDLFACNSCDSTNYGEGQFLLGSVEVSLTGECSRTFQTVLTLPAGLPKFITATATNQANSSTSEFSLCFPVLAPAPFDFDGDRKSDVSVFRPSNRSWFLDRSQAGFFGVLFGLGDDKVAPADFDGDGKTDIAVYRPSTGIWYWLNSSNGAFKALPFGLAEDLPTPADYDGDGKADVSVFRPSTGTWYRLNSSNGSFYGVQFGVSEDKPSVGDFDGDGKADIAVFRPSVGAWYRINSSNGSVAGMQFGISTDLIVPADYDGDGKTDVAVFRPSNNCWYVFNSSNVSVSYTLWGTTDDNPAPADFDGDGKADVNVFRPSDGNWYRLNSSNGQFVATHFGQDGDKPIQTAFRY